MILITFMGGVVLGAFFYGGLWITVRKLVTTDHSVVLTLGSLFARSGFTVVGFILAINGRWQNAVASLGGFVVARVLVGRLARACT